MHVFWSGMLPQDIFDALEGAPRIAGPWLDAWVDAAGVERQPPCRKTPDGMTVVWDREGEIVVHAVALRPPRSIKCATRAEADEVLRQEGWILV